MGGFTSPQNKTPHFRMKFAIMVTGAGKNKILGFMKSIIKDTILEKKWIELYKSFGSKNCGKEIETGRLPESSIIMLTVNGTHY